MGVKANYGVSNHNGVAMASRPSMTSRNHLGDTDSPITAIAEKQQK